MMLQVLHDLANFRFKGVGFVSTDHSGTDFPEILHIFASALIVRRKFSTLPLGLNVPANQVVSTPGYSPTLIRNGRGMSIQSDRWIREQAIKHKMIEPFSEKQVREGVISYGLSSYGYDLRVSDEFKIFTNVNSAIIDPKAFDERSFVSVHADSVIVPPNSFALARSIEYFRIPRDVLTICVGKSTYARCGIIVNVTPFEPEWEGYVTLEISNTTPLPAKVYANEGLCQILFFRSDESCETSYADRKGKYQKQQGIVLPKL